jgi:DNA primase large subunit
MKPVHARYPFLRSAREAVEVAEVDLASVVAAAGPAVERGRERVERAIAEGRVGEPERTRTELLSYPVARVLVSLVDEPVLTRKYARAEAATAHERFSAELAADADYSYATGDDRLTLADLLAEFDLRDAVRETPDGFRVGVGAHLPLAADLRGEEWRLVNRELADGEVPVDRDELHLLLRAAVRRRVEAGLPLSVPEGVAAELDGAVAAIRESLSDLDLTREIDTVVPDLFPPCMKHLLDRIQKGEHLEHHSRFAITAFLTSIGMSTDDIVDLYEVNPGFGEEVTRYQTNHIRGETGPTAYSPPSCATMQSYGDCVNMDDRCETIAHPLAYYDEALDDADEEQLVDWRD